jgi:hypothetical protein
VKRRVRHVRVEEAKALREAGCAPEQKRRHGASGGEAAPPQQLRHGSRRFLQDESAIVANAMIGRDLAGDQEIPAGSAWEEWV